MVIELEFRTTLTNKCFMLLDIFNFVYFAIDYIYMLTQLIVPNYKKLPIER